MRKFWLAVLMITLSVSYFVRTSSAITIGNDVIDRASVDGWSNFSMVDLSLQLTDSGQIDSWSIYAEKEGSVYLQVFRNVSSNIYEVIGENFFTGVSVGVNKFSLLPTERIKYQSGDYIGWTFTNPAIISYDTGGNQIDWTSGSGKFATGVGNTFDFQGPDGYRTYSIAATTSPIPEPASMLLLGSGLIGMFGLKKKKLFRS